MEDKNDSNLLFKKLLNNSITEEELQKLLKYVRNSESKNEINRSMANHWEDIRGKLIENESGLQSDDRYAEILRKLNPVHKKTEKTIHDRASGREFTLRWFGIAASVLVVLSIGLYWSISSYRFSEIPVSAPMASKEFSGKQVVNLPDGSTVVLNENSQLSYTAAFGHEAREVNFSGEGYFDIAHDPKKPFIVHTGEVKTTVLGTAFNLKAYKEQSNVEVTVTRGKVAVGDKKRVFDNILPRQQMIVNKTTHEFKRENVDLDKVLAWQKDFLIIQDMTVENAAELIAKKHQVKISIENDAVKNCKISASFIKGESLEQILRVVCGVLQAEYNIDGNKVEIIGGRQCE